MRVYLHPDFSLRGSKLHDVHLGAAYRLSPDAVWLLKRLYKNAELAQLVSAVVAQRSVSEEDARAAVLTFYAQLGMVGAVRVVWDGLVWWRVRAWATWRQRERASLLGFIKSMWRAYGWLSLGMTSIGILLAHFAKLPLMYGALPIFLFVSCAAHEAGHVAAAKTTGMQAVVLSHVGYSAVSYMPRRGKDRVLTSLAGPLSGAIVCAASGIGEPHILLPLVALAIMHVCCLLPWSADGAAIWRP
ncbi:MAG TPA: hypothetical protein VLI54_02430 [Bacillota bacterium]|nr:hypothetical protein [Bacillota bacterium]